MHDSQTAPQLLSHSSSSETAVVLAIALGGAIGSVARYGVSIAVVTPFPTATLLINVTGSLLIGLFMVAALERPATSVATRLFLTTGICGGYTTMSTFGVDTMRLLRENHFGQAAVYVVVTVCASLLATVIGMMAGRRFAALLAERS
jgi:CrcB protein